MNQLPDFRPQLATAQAWVADLIEGVRDDQWGAPTPCDGWTVTDLVGHLLAVQGRIAAQPQGDVNHLPREIPVPDHPADAFRAASVETTTAWADDATLTRVVTRPYGEVPGAAAVVDFTNEMVVHGWDLATATGQPADTLDDLAAALFPIVQKVIAAERRGGFVPFETVVEPALDAGPTERLANFLGRSSRVAA